MFNQPKTIQCLNPQCGKQNPENTRTCQFCGQNLDLQRFHWARHARDGSLAIRLDASRLPGLLKRGIVIEPGTNGLLVDKGAVKSILGPGEYLLSTVSGEIRNWLETGITMEASVWLVDMTPLDLDFHVGGRFTRDPLPIGASLKLRLQVAKAGVFLINVLKGNAKLTLEELGQLLYPEVTAKLDAWLKKYSLQELAEDAGKMQELEMQVEGALQTLFSQSGLELLQVRTVELNLEPYDEIRGIRASTKLLVYRSQVEDEQAKTQAEVDLRRKQAALEGQKRLDELKQAMDLQALVVKTGEIELQERKTVLYGRMRKTLLDDKMDEEKRAAEWGRFLNDLDTQKLIQEKEKQELVQSWQEQREDKLRGRARLLARLDVEEKFALKIIETKLSGDLDAAVLVNERARLEAHMGLEEQRQAFDLRQRQAAYDFQKRLRDEQEEFNAKKRSAARSEDREDVMLGLEALHTMQMNRLARQQKEMEQKWADDRVKMELRLDEQQIVIDMQLKRDRAAHTMKLEATEQAHKQKIDLIGAVQAQGELGLLFAAEPEQARIMQGLIEDRLKAGRSPEQILAEAAERNPDLLRGLEEMRKDNTQKTEAQQQAANQVALDLLQKQLTLQMEREREHARQQQEMYQTGMQTAAQIARDVAQATSQNRTPPTVFVTGSGTSTNPSESHPAGGSDRRFCPKCGRSVAEDHAFCPKCGYAFPG
jgi:hypothetical protein